MSRLTRTRTFLLVGLALALGIAGVASYYASSAPDGLERTAQDAGFSDSARDSATADSPLADYAMSGVDSERLSEGMAGILGVLVVLVLATLLTRVLRRRRAENADGNRAGVTSTDA